MSSMKCLAIETATAQGSVAASNGAAVGQLVLTDARSSSRELYRAIDQVLGQVGLQPAELDCIAFGCGPGSFTGVRVAASAAQSLAFSLGLPVARISTLEALAHAARRTGKVGDVAVCLDARMGEVYFGLYGGGSSLQVVQADQLLAPEQVRLEGSGWLAAGNGWQVFPQARADNAAAITEVLDDCSPDALALLAIAEHRYAAGELVRPVDAIPNYLRNEVTG